MLGVRCRIGKNVSLRDSVIIGADRFETDSERAANRKRGVPDFTVGDDSVIENAILDKDCRIGRNVRIVNEKKQRSADGENYVIRDGIVVIPNSAVVPDGTVI
jgi:glucose-1-phosphate adenylyltransferase